jgi:hypothetical protein
MKCPAEVYTPATRHCGGLPELACLFHDHTIHVTNCGLIRLYRKKINLSTVFSGQAVGIKEVEERIWLVSFMEYDLGHIALEERTLQPPYNHFGPRCYPCSRYDLLPMCPGRTQELWSGRWESNPRPKLGKLLYCHCTTPARCL